jgi:putative GTP pyrophosphokinase
MTLLEQAYRQRHDTWLVPAALRLEEHLRGCLAGVERIDRIVARAKSVDRFMEKAGKQAAGGPRYGDPLAQIQDQLGARIVTYYTGDVARVTAQVLRFFHPIEHRQLLPDAVSEFGYIGQHLILLLPTDVQAGLPPGADLPAFFELQVKTLFQHAWAEAEHDLRYKPRPLLNALHRRKIAFTAAQAWGADLIFDELFQELGGAGATPLPDAEPGDTG